jgi:cytochrome d ubiquinol oxidase subunit II
MDLAIVWFVLIAVLYIGFFVLEGFDFGVGILLPFLSKGGRTASMDTERRAIINTIGPHWDGNEVWLVTAGGATFAAFPQWYATLFSGFYLALFLLLVALILRGVAFEFRSKVEDPRWRGAWDWAIFIGSLVPALLLGVALCNLVRGVPINAEMQYVGTFFDLLNSYSLLGGMVAVLVFTLHGAIFLSMKASGDLSERARRAAARLWPVALLITLGFLVATYFETDLLSRLGVNPGAVPLAAVVALLLAGYFIRRKQDGLAFAMTCITIAFSLVTLFMVLYPRVMVSSLNEAYSLTIQNASSSPYTLRVMTIVALFFLPVVLVYQGWSYWVFRKRVEAKPETLTY